MSTANKHFGLKLIALTLVITIFATLLPTQLVTRAYAESSSNSSDFLNSDFSYLDFPETEESGTDPEHTNRSDLFAEYEQAALEKLGKPTTVEDIDPYKRSDVKYEIPDIANAFTRNYALESGNYTRIIFGSPVNYKTNEGQWRKIDLSLQKEEGFYQTKDTPYSLKFLSSGTNDTDLLELDFGGISLAMSPANIASSSIEAVYSPAVHTDDELLTQNPCESGSIVYSNIFSRAEGSPSASLEYILEPYKIKENIIVSESGYEQYTYSFGLVTDARSVEITDGSVQLFNESGDTVFELSAAIMTDAKGNASDNLVLSVNPDESGYIVTIVADAEWINAPEREFPVAIDPTIDIEDTDADDAYDAVYVGSNTTGYGICIGNGIVSYIMFSSDLLTGLPQGAVVSHASVGFNGFLFSTSSNTKIAFRSEKIGSAWSPAAVYNSGIGPTVASSYSDLTDSALVNYNLYGSFSADFGLDITQIIRDLISDNSYGFALSTDILSGGIYNSALQISSIQITYSDNSGLNSYQNTHSISIDGSGTAYIKDVNGDLTFIHPGISTKGEILPVSIDLVYSSAFKGTATDSYYGSGWRLSIIQMMKAETVTDINGDTYTYYVLTDGTGGKHYFTHTSGNIYTAEENVFWKYNSSTRSLDYGDGNTAQFNSSGYLTDYINAYGDYYHINFDGATPKVTGVSDGNGVSITFMYGLPYLAGMVNLSCISRAVSLSYTGSNLTKISTPVGESTNFVYNSNGTMSRFGYRKTSSETSDRSYVTFDYSSTPSNGIYSVGYLAKYEKNNNGTYNTCESISIYYTGHTEFCYRYAIIFNTPIYIEYVYFDRSGRTVAVFDSLGNASGSNYEGGDLGNMNLLSGNTSAVMTDGNLVKDFTEKTSAWTKVTVSGSGGFYSETSNSPFPLGKYGSDCFRLKSNSQTTEIYAKYPVPAAVPGKTYTLSAEIDPGNLTGTGGIVLGIMYNTSGSTGVKLLSAPMHYEVDVCAQYTFDIPSNATSGSVSILVGIKNQQGNLYFDLVSLTEGADSRQTNQLANSGFYYGTQEWSQTGTFNATIGTTDRIRHVTIPGNINEEHNLTQTLPTSVFDGGYLVVSGFGKGKAVSSGKFGIIVHFANTSYDDVELLFSNTVSEWQYVSVIIPITNSSIVSIKLVNDYNYTDVCFGGVVAEYVNGLGDYSDRSQYLYDEFGRIVYEKSFSGGEQLYIYEDNTSESVDETSFRDKRRNETTVDYTYNDSINPFAVTQTTETFHPSSNGANDTVTITYYAYNVHGSLLESTTYTDGTRSTHSLYSYASNGRFLEKETDAAGRYITYSYQSSTGDLLSVTNGDSDVTSYTYDSYGRLTNAAGGGASVGLSYGQHYTNISHNGFSYSIGTDNAGNRTSFSILDSNGDLNRTIATYTYGGELGQISKLSYGNGQNKYYGYDSLGNLTFIAYSQNATIDTATFAWYYDQNGNVIKYIDRSDTSNPVTREYSYNPEGKLKYVISSDGSNVLYHYSTSSNSDYEIFTTAGTGKIYNSATTHNDADKTITKYGPHGSTKTITYDSLGRILSATNGSVSKSYEYVCYSPYVTYNGSLYYHKNETALVSKEISSLSTIPTVSYTYYDNGKINTISENNVQVARYEYDSLGQLIREDNKKLNSGAGYTIKYTYDSGGNMVSKTTYSYSPSIATSDLPGNASLQGLATYGYDSTFKDLLTSYYGQSSYYSYDTIGNPLTYMGSKSYTMTWTRGNKLATVKPSGYTYAQSYLYDADGLRTRKTLVSNSNVSTQINYFWVGNTLKSEWAENGAYEIVFDYDAIGRICGFAYSQNGGDATYYRYILNAQGDVTHIVSGNGTIVAAYTYDTWGKLISIKNGSGTDITNNTTSIGYINPIRYRGYYYDNETGFYYLQSRYYDPSMGRFINADSQLNIEDGSIGCNLFTYCGNDPVSGYDPEGTWNWGKFINGLIMVGTAAVCIASVAAIVASCGTLTPAMWVVAGITVAAAEAYAFEGVAEMIEAGTGNNFVRDGLFNGNEDAYEASKSVLYTIMQVGTTVLGVGACFIAGTQVMTDTGPVNIETISAGDYVWAYDEISGAVELKKVLQAFANEADELIHVTVEGAEIACTNDHPFYSPVKGWTAACKLRAGDILVTVNGEFVVVEKIQHEILESPIQVYNFEVEDFHTYFVGGNSILVHNACTNPGGRHGGPKHRQKIDQIKAVLKMKGWEFSNKESRVYYTDTKYRYADIMARKDGVTVFIQVGKQTAEGLPIAREMLAILDLINIALTIFVAYN